jgi:hypothetical protein
MEIMNLKAFSSIKRLTFSLVGVAAFLSAQAQKEEFGMSDGPVNSDFKPVYSYLILGGVFVLAIVIFLIFKKLEKPKKRPNVHHRPIQRAGGSIKRR